MSIKEILLVAAAGIPAIWLAGYVYEKDKVEKEPLGLLLLLFFGGGMLCYPAAQTEAIVFSLIEKIFDNFMIEIDGVRYATAVCFILHDIVEKFIGIALVEEGYKYIIMLFLTRKNKEFNSLFDGIIYATFVSLGFAMIENIIYVVKYGWLTALARAFTSVPGHMFFGVLMGFYYSMWNVYKKAGKLERSLKNDGLIPENQKPITYKRYLSLSLIMPVIAHGFYDYCCASDEFLASICFNSFVLFLYIYCFGRIKKISEADDYNTNCSKKILLKKYPDLEQSSIDL